MDAMNAHAEAAAYLDGCIEIPLVKVEARIDGLHAGLEKRQRS